MENVENLTFTHRLLKETSPDPQTEYTVVVLESSGNGGTNFSYKIAPGQPAPKQPWLRWPWNKLPRYFAFAVAAAPSLRIPFVTDVTMDDQIHKLTLTIDFVFEIGRPELLVRRRNDDPLRRIRDEAVAVFEREIAVVLWDDIVHDFRRVERNIVDDVIGSLRELADDYGLNIHNIRLSRRISEEDERIAAEKRKIAHRVSINEIRYTDQEGRLKDELDIDRMEGRSTLAAFQRSLDFASSGVEVATIALKNVANSMHDPKDLTLAVSQLTSAIAQIRELAIEGNSHGALPPHVASQKALGPAQQTGLIAITTDMMLKTEQMSCGTADKKRLQSAVLQLLAELVTEEIPDRDRVKNARERVAEMGAAASLSGKQLDYVTSLLNTEALRDRLS